MVVCAGCSKDVAKELVAGRGRKELTPPYQGHLRLYSGIKPVSQVPSSPVTPQQDAGTQGRMEVGTLSPPSGPTPPQPSLFTQLAFSSMSLFWPLSKAPPAPPSLGTGLKITHPPSHLASHPQLRASVLGSRVLKNAPSLALPETLR